MMNTHEHAPIGGRLLTPTFIVLLGLVVIGAIVVLQRLIFGLAAVTNLSDGYPWGIWIAIDLIVGTALGCGGFVTAFLVYILNRGQYHPMVRAALMTSLFGYSLGGLAVMFDLGRWWQGYNIMLPWLFNTNSVLLETALCIFCYILVLLVEFAPAFLERFGLTRVAAPAQPRPLHLHRTRRAVADDAPVVDGHGGGASRLQAVAAVAVAASHGDVPGYRRDHGHRHRDVRIPAVVRRLQAAFRDEHPERSVPASPPRRRWRSCFCGSSTCPGSPPGPPPSPATSSRVSFWLEMLLGAAAVALLHAEERDEAARAICSWAPAPSC